MKIQYFSLLFEAMPKAECAFIFITARMVNRFLYVSECLQPDADFARAAPKPEQNGRPMGQEGGHSHTKRLSTSVARGTDRHQEKALTPQTESCHIYIAAYFTDPTLTSSFSAQPTAVI